MTICTRHSSVEHGTKLVLNHSGKTITKIPSPRQVGTTITLSNLFATLPVRKREFKKNIKKEFAKMCQVLQGYCLVSIGVRIVCTNHLIKGARTTVMATNGTPDILNNIISIFGSTQTHNLLKIESPFKTRSNPSAAPFELSDFDDLDSSVILTQEEIDKLNLAQFTIDGWISSCQHGCGRSARDRQYFFVNDRPCEPKQVGFYFIL